MAFGYKPLSEDRYLPAPPSTVFAALKVVASEKFKLRSVDEFMQIVEVKTVAASMSVTGEIVSCQVIPYGDGTTVRLTCRPSAMSGGLLQGGANRRALEDVFRAIVDVLRSGPSPSA